MKHVVPLSGEAQVITHCFGELDRSVGTDILVGDAPRGLGCEEDELPLRSELMWHREHGGEPASGVGGAGLLASLISGMVGSIEVCSRR